MIVVVFEFSYRDKIALGLKFAIFGCNFCKYESVSMKFGAHELHHTKYVSFEWDRCTGGSRPNWQNVVLSLWTATTLISYLKCTYLHCLGMKM